jgi:hypothetical protein
MSPIDDAPIQQVRFANGNIASLAIADLPNHADLLLESLAVKPCDFILLPLGTSPEASSPADAALEQLSPPLLTLLASLGRSMVIDTGTRNWLTAPIQQRKAEKASQVSFLGVAPEALVSYPGNPAEVMATETPRQLDSWHSEFILVESEERWGSQLPMLHAVVKALANRSDYVPVLALLAGDGPCAAEETLAAVRNGIPLAVLEGSGDLADDIINALRTGNTEAGNELIAEITTEGAITVLSKGNFFGMLTDLIGQRQKPDEVLALAWENFATYDLNANYQQRKSNRTTYSIIALGVVGTVLAVVQQLLYGQSKLAFDNLTWGTFWPWMLHYSLLIIPILLTILVAAAYKFKISSKWFVLRAGAEALKGEIYTYRTRALDYKKNAAQQLAIRMGEITKRTMQSEASGSHLKVYDKALGLPPYLDTAEGSDKGFGYLAPERYVEVRLEDQLRYFRARAQKLDRQFQILYWLTLIIGGISTLLAAVSEQIWIAVTASLTTALGTLLSYRQTEANLLKFNQAATDLDNINSWWKALGATEKSRQSNIDLLVDRTEKVLQTALDSWVQQMKNALEDLEKKQAATAEAAQKWKPAVRFTSRSEEERANAANAEKKARIQVAALAETHLEPIVPAVAVPEQTLVAVELSAAPAAPEVTIAVGEASQPTAQPALVDIEVKLNGTAPVPVLPLSKPKLHWETADITAALLRQTIESKNFKWFDDQPNIIGIRTTSYEKNTFGDRLFCCWKQPDFPVNATIKEKQQFLIDWGYKGENGRPLVADGDEGANTKFALAQLSKDVGKDRLMEWAITTRPGTDWLKKPIAGGCAVLVPDQYINAYQLGLHRSNPKHPALVQRGLLTIYRDNNRNDIADEIGRKEKGLFGINIHHAGENSTYVNNWSAGCQVFKRIAEHVEFLRICKRFKNKNFSYTLLHESALA